MALKIFGTDPDDQPKPRQSFHDDVVGRFRSGYQLNNRPMALTEWRLTTGDPEVADKLHEVLGGDDPQEWDTKGEDNLELFTATGEIEILLEKEKSIRQRMVLWSRNGKLIVDSDGETLSDGTPDPDAEMTFAERKVKGREGIGPSPQIEIYFRLAEEPDLGIFKFQTGSWSMAQDMAANDTEGVLAELLEDAEDGQPVKAKLKLEHVEFTAKNGPRAGQLVSYTKPVLTLKGA